MTYKTNIYVDNLQIDLISSQKLVSLNGFFTKDVVKVVLLEKDYKSVDMAFRFNVVFMDRATDCCHQAPLTVLTAYSNLLCSPLFDKSRSKDVNEYCAQIENYFGVLKDSGKHLFEYLEYENLYTLKSHALNHVTKEVDDLKTFLS